MDSGCDCERCVAARSAHAADPGILRDCWLRQSLQGGCRTHHSTCCHTCGFEFASISRLEVVVPGWEHRSWKTAWVSEDLLAAVGWQEHRQPYRPPPGYDLSDMGVLRRVAGLLRTCASRRKLLLLGMCNDLSLSLDMTKRSRLRQAGISGVLLNIIEAGPEPDAPEEPASEQSDDDAQSETDVRFRCELTALVWLLSLATAGNLLAVTSEHTRSYARTLKGMLKISALLPDLDDSERFTIAVVYANACKALGNAGDLRGLFPEGRTSSRAAVHLGSADDGMSRQNKQSSDAGRGSSHLYSTVDSSSGNVRPRSTCQGPGHSAVQAAASSRAASSQQPAQLKSAPQHQSKPTPQQRRHSVALTPSMAAGQQIMHWGQDLEDRIEKRLGTRCTSAAAFKAAFDDELGGLWAERMIDEAGSPSQPSGKAAGDYSANTSTASPTAAPMDSTMPQSTLSTSGKSAGKQAGGGSAQGPRQSGLSAGAAQQQTTTSQQKPAPQQRPTPQQSEAAPQQDTSTLQRSLDKAVAVANAWAADDPTEAAAQLLGLARTTENREKVMALKRIMTSKIVREAVESAPRSQIFDFARELGNLANNHCAEADIEEFAQHSMENFRHVAEEQLPDDSSVGIVVTYPQNGQPAFAKVATKAECDALVAEVVAGLPCNNGQPGGMPATGPDLPDGAAAAGRSTSTGAPAKGAVRNPKGAVKDPILHSKEDPDGTSSHKSSSTTAGSGSARSRSRSGFSFGAALGIRKERGAATAVAADAAEPPATHAPHVSKPPESAAAASTAGPNDSGAQQNGREGTSGNSSMTKGERSDSAPDTGSIGSSGNGNDSSNCNTSSTAQAAEPPATILQLAPLQPSQEAASCAASPERKVRRKRGRKKSSGRQAAAANGSHITMDSRQQGASAAGHLPQAGHSQQPAGDAPALQPAAGTSDGDTATAVPAPTAAAADQEPADADALAAELLASSLHPATSTGDLGEATEDTAEEEDPFAWMHVSQPSPTPSPPPAPPALRRQVPRSLAAPQQQQQQRQQQPLAGPSPVGAAPTQPPQSQLRHGSAQAARAASTKRHTREPKHAAANRRPANPRNAFELLEDDVSDTEGGAAADAGGSSGSLACPQGAGGLRSADAGSTTATVTAAAAAAAATADAAAGGIGIGAAAATAAALPQFHPCSSSDCSSAARQPEQQQAPSQPEQPPPPAGPPPQAQAPVPAAQLPVTVLAAMLGDDCVGNFECPLTLDVMEDPVVCSDGSTYEREAIERWMSKSNLSPMTGAPLLDKTLMPNKALQGAIRTMMARRG